MNLLRNGMFNVALGTKTPIPWKVHYVGTRTFKTTRDGNGIEITSEFPFDIQKGQPNTTWAYLSQKILYKRIETTKAMVLSFFVQSSHKGLYTVEVVRRHRTLSPSTNTYRHWREVYSINEASSDNTDEWQYVEIEIPPDYGYQSFDDDEIFELRLWLMTHESITDMYHDPMSLVRPGWSNMLDRKSSLAITHDPHTYANETVWFRFNKVALRSIDEELADEEWADDILLKRYMEVFEASVADINLDKVEDEYTDNGFVTQFDQSGIKRNRVVSIPFIREKVLPPIVEASIPIKPEYEVKVIGWSITKKGFAVLLTPIVDDPNPNFMIHYMAYADI